MGLRLFSREGVEASLGVCSFPRDQLVLLLHKRHAHLLTALFKKLGDLLQGLLLGTFIQGRALDPTETVKL